MKKKVVVTGANGHVGNNLVKELLNRGYDVRATVRDVNDKKKTEMLKNMGVEIVQADLLDKDSLIKAFSGCEGLFQIAAGFKMHTKNMDLDVRQPALKGTVNALEAAKAAGIEKIIYTSSVASVGTAKVGYKKNESDWNDEGVEYYAQCKTEGERLLWSKSKELGLKVVAILPGAIIGPNFYRHTPSTYFIEKLVKGKVPMIPPVAFSFVDVRDVVNAHILAYESDEANGRYIACGELTLLTDAINILKKLDSTLKLPTKFVPKWLVPILPFLDSMENKLTGNMITITKGVVDEYLDGSVQDFDTSKIKNDLKWKPRPLEETLQDTMDWIKGNNTY